MYAKLGSHPIPLSEAEYFGGSDGIVYSSVKLCDEKRDMKFKLSKETKAHAYITDEFPL